MSVKRKCKRITNAMERERVEEEMRGAVGRAFSKMKIYINVMPTPNPSASEGCKFTRGGGRGNGGWGVGWGWGGRDKIAMGARQGS